MYSYYFEAPQGACYDPLQENVEVKGDNYSNIFNVINMNDAVPKVAMNVYDFTRFGNDIFVTDSLIDPSYKKNIEVVKDYYSK